MKNYIKTKLHWKETSKQFSVLINPKIIKKRYQNDHQILFFQKHIIKIASKYIEKTLTFRQSKLFWKKYIEMTSIFFPSKLHWRKYIETTSIFRSSILCRIKYVETAWIFCPSKVRRKSTSKRQGFFAYQNYIEKIRRNDVKIRRYFFSTYRRNIDIESTLIQRVTAIGKVSIFFINVYHFFVHGLILISLNNIFSTKSSCHQS